MDSEIYSHIYIRVGSENKLLEELAKKERAEWLGLLDREALIRTVHILCDTLKEAQDQLLG